MQQKIVSNDFIIQKINPFTNKEYDNNWVYVEVNDEEGYFILDSKKDNIEVNEGVYTPRGFATAADILFKESFKNYSMN